jgi:hypothetical protein
MGLRCQRLLNITYFCIYAIEKTDDYQSATKWQNMNSRGLRRELSRTVQPTET